MLSEGNYVMTDTAIYEAGGRTMKSEQEIKSYRDKLNIALAHYKASNDMDPAVALVWDSQIKILEWVLSDDVRG